MNEVRVTQTSAEHALRSASSKGAGTPNPPVSGKTLPAASNNPPVGKAPQAPKVDITQVHDAVDKANSFVQSINRDLHFSIDEELDTTVIKVVDSDSGKLIRQIPEDVFLELARRLNEDGDMHLMDALG